MSPITTHVLDTTHGRPAEGITVSLERRHAGAWKALSKRRTNADGRVTDLLPAGTPPKGVYRLVFETAAYFKKKKVQGFYPEVAVAFEIRDARHHHVPLLLNPFGYSTYRGS